MKKIEIYTMAVILCALTAMVIGISVLASNNSLYENIAKTEEDYILSAQNYAKDGDYQEAAVSYQKALEFNGENVISLKGMGEAYVSLEYYEEAEEVYSMLTSAPGAEEDDFLNLINIKLKLKKMDEAKGMIIELYEDNPSKQVEALYEQIVVKAPQFNYGSGSYDHYFLLELQDNPYMNIYYTLDGTEPTENSQLYTDGIVISQPDTQFRAKAISYLGYESDVVKLDFTITVPVEEVSSEQRYGTLYRLQVNILNKSWDAPVYNYELAQIRSLYLVGEWYCSAEAIDADFYADYYMRYNSYETNRGMADMDVIVYMPFLKTLAICYQEDLSLDNLAGLDYLEELSLLNDGIDNIDALSNLTNLKQLALGWNNIEDISPLANLHRLESLGLWNNQISSIDSLSNLSNLYYFDISHNQVSDIRVTSGMPGLTEVWINDNAIQDISPFDGCENLKVVHFKDNPITEYGKWDSAFLESSNEE